MIGILCGLRAEAKIADKIPDVLVGCSEARADKARALVWHMVDSGVDRLISFGLAGAASPDLTAGDLILGATVMAAGGKGWEADTVWNDRLIEGLPEPLCVPMWGSKRIVSTLEEKEAIYRRAGCMAIDMESHIVAEVAAEADIPFNIVRAIADTADMILPEAARVPLKEGGRVDLWKVLASIKKNPSQIKDLLKLSSNTAKAMRSLKGAVAVIRSMST